MLDEAGALQAINSLILQLDDQPVNRIEYEYRCPDLLILYASDLDRANTLEEAVAKTIAMAEIPELTTFRLEIRISPFLRPLIAGPNIKPIYAQTVLPAMGGDPCYIEGSNSWGTAGMFFHDGTIEVVTGGGVKYAISGTDAFLSNNHVLAANDARGAGTPLIVTSTPGQRVQARSVSGGFVPLYEPTVFLDLAVGTNMDPASYQGGALRDLGSANPVFRNPADSGETIRKSGARTGVTFGATTGRAGIRAPGHLGSEKWYNGVYKTTPGFSDHGDSGSIVIGTNDDIVGMIAWGDNGNPPIGYFFTFADQARPVRLLWGNEDTQLS